MGTSTIIEAEIWEYIIKKRYTLDEYRAGRPRVSHSLIKVLEKELHDLEYALATEDANIKKVLLDKCAGQ